MAEKGKKSKNLMILACEKIKDKTCVGCQRCFMAMDRKSGEFERYKDDGAQIMAIIDCGGCPGVSPVVRMVNLKTWMAPFNETIEVVHIGTCVMENCPHKESMLQKIKGKAGVPVVEGTHDFRPANIFAG